MRLVHEYVMVKMRARREEPLDSYVLNAILSQSTERAVATGPAEEANVTSEVQPKRQVEAESLDPDGPPCLCCCHFAIDLESMPEETGKRRARLPKRKHLAGVESAA
jgi:hypothetical protein